MAVALDLSQLNLTNRDMVDFQRVVGMSVRKAFSPEETGNDENWTAITALFWILKRKKQPGYTFDDALDAEISEEEYNAILPTMPVPVTNGTGRRTKSKA